MVHTRQLTYNSLIWFFVLGCCLVTWGQQPKSTQEAIDAYNVATGYHNGAEYKDAAQLWGKFLTNYPKDPLAPFAKFYLAVCQKQLQQWAPAETNFTQLLTAQPKFKFAVDARYLLGETQFNLATTLRAESQIAKYKEVIATLSKLLAANPPKPTEAGCYYYLGEANLNCKQYDQAIAAYQQLVAKHPKSQLRPDGLLGIGSAYYEQAKYADAIKSFEQFANEYPKHEQLTEGRMRHAESLYGMKKYESADKLLAMVIADDKYDALPNAMSLRGKCLFRLGRQAEAGDVYAAIFNRYPQQKFAGEAVLNAGRSYFAAKDYDKATKWFERLVEAPNSNSPEAAYWLAQIMLAKQQPQRVTQIVTPFIKEDAKHKWIAHLRLVKADALNLDPANRTQAMLDYAGIANEYPEASVAPQALYNAAFAARELGKFETAISYRNVFIKRYANDTLLPDVEYVAAESELRLNQVDSARQSFQRLVTKYPNHASVELWQLRVAACDYQAKKYQEAVNYLNGLTNINSKSARAERQHLLGTCQFQLNKFAEAETAFVSALAADSNWRQAASSMIYLSRTYFRQKNIAAAKQTITKCIDSFPNSPLLPEAHYRLGNYLYEEGKFAEAASEFGTVGQLDPKNTMKLGPLALDGKGWSELQQKKSTEAITTFSQLIQQFPEQPTGKAALLTRGMVYRQGGKPAEAIADFNKFLATNPTATRKSDCQLEIALTQIGQKNYDEAVTTLRQILTDNPQYKNGDKVLYEMAWALNDAKKLPQAQEAFAKLTADFPASRLAADANYRIGEDLFEKKDFAKARGKYLAAQAAKIDGELGENVAHKLAWTYYEEKEFAKAADHFRKQVTAFENGKLVADGQFMIGESLYKQDEYDKAIAEFEKVPALATKLTSPQFAQLRLLHLGQSANQTKNWTKAAATLNQLISQYPKSASLTQARFELGRALQGEGKLDEAVKEFAQAAKSRTPIGAQAQFMSGEIAFLQKQYPVAIERFKRVMYGYSSTPRNAPEEIRRWQARAGFEAARCAEVRIAASKANEKPALIDLAKKYYTYVVKEHPKSSIRPKAQTRLAALSKLGTNR